MQDAPSFRTVHDALLARYASTLSAVVSPAARLACFRRVSTACLLDAAALQAFFAQEVARGGGDEKPSVALLKEIYLAWRRRDVVDASLAWARWLLSAGDGREAGALIQRARGEADGPSRQRLEDVWRHIVEESTKRPEADMASDDAMDED